MDRRQSLKAIGSTFAASLLPIKSFSNFISSTTSTCEEAWGKLNPKTTSKYYVFRYIKPEERLPKVFIYGDSISIGYTEYVRACLKDKASVHRLHMNGGSSKLFIRMMERIRKSMFQPFLKDGWNFDWDVIHFNIGLHDLKYVIDYKILDKINGSLVSTESEYEENLHNICKYLEKTYPNTKLIFATTTTIPEGEPGRFEGDEVKYNEVALKVVKQYKNITINDLYSASIPVHKEHNLGPGNVHFNKEGYRKLGIKVADEIAKAIGVEPLECPPAREMTRSLRTSEMEFRRKQRK